MSVRRLEHAPSLTRLFGKAVVTARGRHGDALPETAYARTDVAIDRSHLANYCLVCGFRQSDILPPTYPHVLGFPAAVTLMVDRSFPFPLPGLVHVNNRIQQARPIHADETLTIGISARNLRDHPRGRQFDMITEVTVDGQVVWAETSTYLRRERHSPTSASSQPPPAATGEKPSAPTAVWHVRRDVGRRYAAASGDVNPIHLNPLAARLFGFPRTIAHGMWLKARCLAALEGRLPDALYAEVQFKSPLLLPSTAAFSAHSADGGWEIAVANLKSGRPHLIGRVR